MWLWLLNYLDCAVFAVTSIIVLLSAIRHIRLHRRLKAILQSHDLEQVIPLARHLAPLAYWNRDPAAPPPDAQVQMLQHVNAVIRSAAPPEPAQPAAS